MSARLRTLTGELMAVPQSWQGPKPGLSFGGDLRKRHLLYLQTLCGSVPGGAGAHPPSPIAATDCPAGQDRFFGTGSFHARTRGSQKVAGSRRKPCGSSATSACISSVPWFKMQTRRCMKPTFGTSSRSSATHEKQGGKFKLTNDPRVTRIGRLLRRTSLDELPQLFNVLKGEMSLVGPRPVPPYEVACYRPGDHQRLAALPGITGLWQVNGRCRVSFEEMIHMDLDTYEPLLCGSISRFSC